MLATLEIHFWNFVFNKQLNLQFEKSSVRRYEDSSFVHQAPSLNTETLKHRIERKEKKH